MIALLSAAAVAASLTTGTCENLTQMSLENASIQEATAVAEGPFEAPGAQQAPPGARGDSEPLPAHCRVKLMLTPTPSSNINVELWLPMEDWNGKFLAVGNGGWAGAIQGYGDMQEALRRGYATAGTDTGHSAEDGPVGRFALGQPEKIIDFAYRAVHDMTEKSKRLITRFYSRPADLSYFKGCSTGGRQAVMAAQRYPGDYDGIIAGALANRHIHMHTAQVSQAIDVNRNPQKAIPEVTAKMVNEAVMAKCDVLNEGFLNNPRQCSFDFSTLQCPPGENADSCLSPPQLEWVETYYGGIRNSEGELIFSGQALSSPLPATQSSDEAPTPFLFDTVRYLGFQDEDYDWQDFDLDKDMPIIDARAGFIDAVNPDLRAFKAQGGKLLLYTGWEDTGITPENTVWYYENVLEEMEGPQDDWLRLFMVPGMGHCRGGDGPHAFDTITVLEQWREQGQAPEQIMASNPDSGLSRPLCPYPEYAKYDGEGDLADSVNWACAAPQEGSQD